MYTGLSSPYCLLIAVIRSSVARSPSSACAGPPGSARIQKKMISDSPMRIGMSKSSRRMVNRSTTTPRRLLCSRYPLPDRDRVEDLQTDRARLVALYVRCKRECGLRMDVRDARDPVGDRLVRLLVQVGPLRRVGLDLRVVQDLLDRLVRVLHGAPALLLALEERPDEVVGVAVVTRPAEQVDRGLPLVDLAEVVRAPRRRVRHDLEAGLVQAGGERLVVLLRVRHVRPRDVRRIPEVDLQRHLDARLLEQLLRLGRVVAVLRDRVVVADDLRRHELVRDHAAARVERVDDGLPVEPVRQRLAHLQVVERRVVLVDPHVRDVERRPVEDLEARVALDRVDVLRLDEVVPLDLTRLQGLQPRRVVGDRTEDQLVDLRLLAPVVVVLDERELVAARPGIEGEGARADRMLGAERPRRVEDPVRVDAPLVGAVLLQRLRARDSERRERQRAEERCGRLRQLDHGRLVVLRRAALIEAAAERLVLRRVLLEAAEHGLPVVRGGRVLERPREVVPAVEVGADRRGVEVGAVLELDSVAEMERPRLPVWARVPARGECGRDLRAAGLQGDEALEDLLDDADRLAVGDKCAVEHDRIGSAGEDERAALAAASTARAAAASAAARRCDHECRRAEQKSDPQCHLPHLAPFPYSPPPAWGRKLLASIKRRLTPYLPWPIPAGDTFPVSRSRGARLA